MNQILFNKKERNKIRYIFKVQFIISIVVAAILIIYMLVKKNNDEELQSISKIINKNIELNSIYQTQKTSNEQIYLGRIYIDKIGLNYAIFNNINDELLKIAPCRFYGVNIGEKGNICIAGHNYNDKNFFSRLDELDIKDKIRLVDLNGNNFEYIIFDIFEIEANDTSIFKTTKNYELTLLTCNNSNQKRIIVKAYMKEY